MLLVRRRLAKHFADQMYLAGLTFDLEGRKVLSHGVIVPIVVEDAWFEGEVVGSESECPLTSFREKQHG